MDSAYRYPYIAQYTGRDFVWAVFWGLVLEALF
jgi:hypothetical protein